MAKDAQQPASEEATQRTEKGLEIPVPKRKDVMDAFRKIARVPKRSPVCPWCGEKETFGPEGTNDVCSNCGFDFRKDDY